MSKLFLNLTYDKVQHNNDTNVHPNRIYTRANNNNVEEVDIYIGNYTPQAPQTLPRLKDIETLEFAQKKQSISKFVSDYINGARKANISAKIKTLTKKKLQNKTPKIAQITENPADSSKNITVDKFTELLSYLNSLDWIKKVNIHGQIEQYEPISTLSKVTYNISKYKPLSSIARPMIVPAIILNIPISIVNYVNTLGGNMTYSMSNNTYYLNSDVNWSDATYCIGLGYDTTDYTVFDGQGHNIIITDIFNSYCGLFTNAGSGRIIIQNLTISLHGDDITMAQYAGGYLISPTDPSDINCSIYKCNFYGNLNTTITSGFVGYNLYDFAITDSNFYGDINCTYSAGFFAGIHDNIVNCVITNCNSYGNINAINSGGVITNIISSNHNHSLTITGCSFVGDINLFSDISAGIIGGISVQDSGNTIIENCSMTGNIYSDYSGGIISNINNNNILVVDNCNLKGNIYGNYCGGICGDSSIGMVVKNCHMIGDIINNYITNNISGGSGGICGTGFGGTINSCYMVGNVDAPYSAGICAGESIRDIAISGCYLQGSITNVGCAGICAPNCNSVYVTSCRMNGNIQTLQVLSDYIIGAFLSAGICSFYITKLENYNCSFNGQIEGEYNSGICVYIGVENSNVIIDSCTSTCNITSTEGCAGICCGYGDILEKTHGLISNCTYIGDINGIFYAGICTGGFDTCIITNCNVNGNMSTITNINVNNNNTSAGICIYNNKTIINDCTYTGNIYGTDIVGICSKMVNGSIINCSMVGNMNGFFNAGICGAVSGATDSDKNVYIANCSFSGSISGSYSGGIVGTNFGSLDNLPNSTIVNCTSSGSILGTSCGGICAGSSGNFNMYNSSFTGSIEGPSSGGLCGEFIAGITLIRNCSFKGDVKDVAKGSGGICGSYCGNPFNVMSIYYDFTNTFSTFSNILILDCYAKGQINNNLGAGGICGSYCGSQSGLSTDISSNRLVRIKHCYSENWNLCGSHCGAYKGKVQIENSFTRNDSAIISKDRPSSEYVEDESVKYVLNGKKFNLLNSKNKGVHVSLSQVKKSFNKKSWVLTDNLPKLLSYIKYKPDPNSFL